MIKLYIFESVDQALAFNRGPTSVEVRVPPEANSAEPPEPRRKYAKRKAKKSDTKREAFKANIPNKARKGNKCSLCGKPGHKRSTCPEAKDALKLTEDQIAYIKEQAEAGASVGEIARETGLPENVVRRHW